MKSDFRILLAAAVFAAVAFVPGCQGAQPTAGVKSAEPAPAPPVDAAAELAERKLNDGRYLYEDEIEPGMKGYGLTVMSGGKIERFEVEVIDVVKSFSPGDNAILVRCSGLGLEHTGIIAGMSGSPVYIQGKMIGAIAFGWGMAKDPVAGVQPIRQMLAIGDRKAETRFAAQGGGGGGAIWMQHGALARAASKMAGWGPLTAALGKRVGGTSETADGVVGEPKPGRELRGLMSPLMVSGLSSGSMKLLEEGLEGTGLVAVASGSGGGAAGGKGLGGMAGLKPGDIKLAPGSAIAVPLVTGDMDMSAIGTVTEVRDGRVFAFGHAFLAEGDTAFPMATGYIYTVMANVNQSFKMGASLKAAGTLVMDEQTGIMGVQGAPPATVPVSITVKNGGGPAKIYRYQMSQHAKLTPVILNAMLNETLAARRVMPAQFTAHIAGEVTFAGKKVGETVRVRIENLGSTDSFQAAETLLPIMVLTDNPFDDLQMTGLSLEATIEPVNRGGAIRSVRVDRLSVAPGDEIHAVAEVERFQKDTVRVPVTIKVPADAADGDYELAVGTPAMALMQETQYAPQRFDPQDIGGLKAAVERIEAYSAEHLYATLVMDISGAAVAGRERRNLPPSRVMMYASDRRTDAVPVMRVARQEADAGVILESGGQTFTVHVNRKADERYFSGKGGAKGESADREPSGKVMGREPPASEPGGD